MRHQLVTTRVGDPWYEVLVGKIRADEDLLALMWDQAEHRFDEHPDKVWSVAAVHDGGRWVPAAWAAAVPDVDEGARVLRCCDNYERVGYRGRGLYAAAYAHRHRTVIAPSDLPGVTYLFADPIALHVADGWVKTGLSGTSTATGRPHQWWQLRRDPIVGASAT